MKTLSLVVVLALAASSALAQYGDAIPPRNGDATALVTKSMAKVQQCRYCFKHNSKFCVKATAPRPLLSDHDGLCVSSYEACPTGTVALKSSTDCAEDAPVTKRSCSLCVLDSYVWCPTPANDAYFLPSVNIGSEYDGVCVQPAQPPHDGSTGAAQPKPGDPEHHKPQPPSEHHWNPCAEAMGPYVSPIRYLDRCPAMVVQKQATDCTKYPPPTPEPHMPVHSHSEQSAFGMFFSAVLSVLCIAVLCYCCKRRRQLRLLAQQRAQAQAASGVAPPVAEPVNPYTLPIPIQAQAQVQYQPYAPSHIAAPAAPEPQIQYPQVIQTAPVRAVGGPVIASNISFVPRDDVELGPVGSNGYARVAQNE